MPQKIPDIDKVDPCLQHMHTFAVAKNMGSDWEIYTKGRILFCLIYIFVNDIRNPPPGEFLLFLVYKQRPASLAYVCISHMSVKIMLEEVLGLIHDRYLSGLISFSMQSNNRRLFNPYILCFSSIVLFYLLCIATSA